MNTQSDLSGPIVPAHLPEHLLAPLPAPDLASSTDSYALRFAGPTGAWLLSRQTAAIAELMAPWSGAEVLDVGGGHAQVTPPLAAAGHRVKTLVSCVAASERLRRISEGRANILIGPLSPLPLPGCSVDVVVSMRMMAHVEDWQVFLAGLCQVARDAVIIDFPVPVGANALSPLLFGAKKKIEKDTRRYRSIPITEVAQVFAAQGFEVDAHIGQFVLPMAFHRAVKTPDLSRRLEQVAAPLARRFGNPVILRARRV